MNCRLIRHRLSAYLDGELDAAETSIIKTHLDSCGRCRAEYERLRAVTQVMRASPAREVPADVASRIAAIAREAGTWRDRVEEPRLVDRLRIYIEPAWDSFYAATAAAAAVLVVAILGGAGLVSMYRGAGTSGIAGAPRSAGLAGAPAAPSVETVKAVSPGVRVEGEFAGGTGASGATARPKVVTEPLPLRPQVVYSDRNYSQSTLVGRTEGLQRPRQFARRYAAGDASRLYLQVLHDIIIQAEMEGLGSGWLVRCLDSVTQRTGGLSMVSYAELTKVQGRQAWVIVVNRLPDGPVKGKAANQLRSRWVYVFDRMGRLMLEFSL